MADDQFNPQNFGAEPLKRVPPPPPLIRPREPESENFSSAPVAPPPAPEISMRTMEGDIRSIKEGAPSPTPESVLPSELKDILEQPETVNQMGVPIVEEPSGSKKILKVLIISIVVLLVGGGLGFAGYKYVYPVFFGEEESDSVVAPLIKEQPPIQTRVTHKTYFVGSVQKTTINFRDLNLINITQALRQVPVEQNRTLKEAEIFDVTGGQIYAQDFLSNILPLTDVDKKLLADSLDPDFTAYLYYDKDIAWPGYVFKLKPTASAIILQQSFLPVVELMDLSVFYLTAPGTFQPFKDGKVGSYSTRYAVGSQAVAAFNHGILGEYLVFSASYDGLKAAVAALGL